jgi:hypothetical protein
MPPPPLRARDLPIPPMDKSSGDKLTAFTWAMGHLILARIAEGETVKAITADARMPAYCTVFQWMRVVPEFGKQVATVRAMLAQTRLSERDAYRRVRGRRRSGQKPRCSARALDLLLARVRGGSTVSAAVAQPGAPSAKALYTRVRNCPGFRAAFVDACDWRAAWLAFQAELVVDEVGDWRISIPAANAKIAALKARRGRLTPKIYRTLPSLSGF